MVFINSPGNISEESIVKREVFIGNDISLVAITQHNSKNYSNYFVFLFMIHQDQDDSFIFVESIGTSRTGDDIPGIFDCKLYKDNIKQDPKRNEIYKDIVSNIKSDNYYISSFNFVDTDKNGYKRCTLTRSVDKEHIVLCDLYVNLNMFFMFSMFRRLIGYEKNAESILVNPHFNSMKLIDIDYVEMGSSTVYDGCIYTHYVVHSGITGYSFSNLYDCEHLYTTNDLIDPMDAETYKAMYEENDSVIEGFLLHNDKLYIAIYGASFLSNNPLGKKIRNEKKEHILLGIPKELCKYTNLLDPAYVVKGE